MVDYRELARGLTEKLGLKLSPISICFTDKAPADIPHFNGQAPAGCLFWQEAAKGAFTTSTADHELCAIGVHTHNLSEPSPTTGAELNAALQVMGELRYVTEEEVAGIPIVQRPAKHVVYAPLAETPLPPDVVLLFADAQQGLVITEAVQRLQPGAPPAMGRPACAVVPQAMNSGRAALSLGCCGARAYLDELSDDVAMWAIPGVLLADFAECIAVMAAANSTLSMFHKQRREDVEAGQRPTVQESLARLGTA